MVKIPALELEGQNWKFYRAKYLEAAATYYCLDVLGGRPDDGTDDWEEGNALLCSLFMETIPASIYYRICLKSAHQIYNYLAKHFRDNNPIQELCAKKFAARANEDKRYSSAEAPTSENAAAERHAHADREDPPTKDLTRGNEDVNDRNVGRTEGPCTSLEASAKGTSAESAGTTVQLESAPHKTQNEPQNSLPLTPRLPIDGKPGECKQEAADGVVMAERTIGMVERAELKVADVDRTATAACGVNEGTEIIADVDRTALLGREPAERASGVGEGDETEREHESQPQQINFYCKESCQRNGNANGNVPSAHKLPLEGEWVVCASGEVSSSSGHADESIAALSASTVQPELTDGPSESRKAEDTAGVELRGCKGGTSGRANVDEADGDADRELERVDAQNELVQLLTTTVEPYVSDGDTNACVHLKCTSWRAGDANGSWSHADASSMHTDTHCGGNETETAENEAETVRTRQTDEEMQDSPNAREIATPKPTIRWKKVSAGGIDIYVPQNAPIEATSRIFVFGRVESEDEAIAPSLEGERAGDGDGDGNGGDGDDGDADGTTSSDGVDSTRVNAAQLATDSQCSAAGYR